MDYLGPAVAASKITSLNIASNFLFKNGGIEAIVSMLDNGAISSINLLKNNIPVKQAQELVKIMQAKEILTTLCGLSREETALDFSSQHLVDGDAVLIANDISDMGALTKLDITRNMSMFSNELCMTLLKLVIDSRIGLRIQVEEGNNFSAVNKHTMEFVLLGMFEENVPTEVNVESAGLTGITVTQ
jgi:hypothetical protein